MTRIEHRALPHFREPKIRRLASSSGQAKSVTRLSSLVEPDRLSICPPAVRGARLVAMLDLDAVFGQFVHERLAFVGTLDHPRPPAGCALEQGVDLFDAFGCALNDLIVPAQKGGEVSRIGRSTGYTARPRSSSSRSIALHMRQRLASTWQIPRRASFFIHWPVDPQMPHGSRGASVSIVVWESVTVLHLASMSPMRIALEN